MFSCEWMITYFCKPKLKVGTEWVQKGSSCSLAAQSVSGIARAIYERSFRITGHRQQQYFQEDFRMNIECVRICCGI